MELIQTIKTKYHQGKSTESCYFEVNNITNKINKKIRKFLKSLNYKLINYYFNYVMIYNKSTEESEQILLSQLLNILKQIGVLTYNDLKSCNNKRFINNYYIMQTLRYKVNFLHRKKGTRERFAVSSASGCNILYFENKKTALLEIQHLREHDKRTNARNLWKINYKIKKTK